MAKSWLDRVWRRATRAAGVRRFRFFNREITQPPSPASTQDGIHLDRASELHVADLCGRPEFDLRLASTTAAFQRGDFCVVAYDGGRPAGYCWLAFSPLPHLDDVWVRFGPDVVWTYKSLVLPSYRGRGIAAQLYRFADVLCLERHRRCSVICVESHNESSINAALKADYDDAGSGGYLRRAGVFLDWYSSPMRRDGVSFFIPARRERSGEA